MKISFAISGHVTLSYVQAKARAINGGFWQLEQGYRRLNSFGLLVNVDTKRDKFHCWWERVVKDKSGQFLSIMESLVTPTRKQIPQTKNSVLSGAYNYEPSDSQQTLVNTIYVHSWKKKSTKTVNDIS